MGSLVGAFTSFVATYANERSRYRRDFLGKQFAQRETLYSEFINEAARLEIESLDRQMEKASVGRQADCTLWRFLRPRLTFSRMSEAAAVQTKGLGSAL